MTIDKDLLKAIASQTNLTDLERFFDELFTPGEIEDISLRWKLLKDLQDGLTQRRIAGKYGISLCKITRGSKILKRKDSVVLKILTRTRQDMDKGE
ncbi:MAG: Trp family transcriptional regulator [Pseudomonadota bacterium]